MFKKQTKSFSLTKFEKQHLNLKYFEYFKFYYFKV